MRKVLAVVLVICFFFLFYLESVAVVGQAVLLNPAYFKAQLAQHNVYNQAYPLILANMRVSSTNVSDLLLTSADQEQIVREVAPPEYLRRQTESVIDAVFAWFASPATSPAIDISLRDVKSRLPQAVATTIERKVGSLPQCAAGYLPRNLSLPDCIPPGLTQAAINAAARPVAQGIGQSAAASVPDSVSLIELLGGSASGATAVSASLIRLKWVVGLVRLGSIVACLMLLATLACIGILMRGPGRGGLKWLGIALLAAGLASLAVTVAATPLALDFVDQFAQTSLRSVPGAFDTVGEVILRGFARDIAFRLYTSSGLTAALGLALLIVRRVLA